MSLSPVISGTALTKNIVVWTENSTIWSSTDGVHGARFQINQNSAGYIFATGSLIVVDIDAFQLKLRSAVVRSGGVNTVLVRDDFPEL